MNTKPSRQIVLRSISLQAKWINWPSDSSPQITFFLPPTKMLFNIKWWFSSPSRNAMVFTNEIFPNILNYFEIIQRRIIVVCLQCSAAVRVRFCVRIQLLRAHAAFRRFQQLRARFCLLSGYFERLTTCTWKKWHLLSKIYHFSLSFCSFVRFWPSSGGLKNPANIASCRGSTPKNQSYWHDRGHEKL